MNPAERLLKTYDKLVSQQVDQAMFKTWAEVFTLDANSSTIDDEVTDHLIALRNELDFAKRLLTNKYAVPNGLLEPGFTRLRAVSSPGLMNQVWSSVRGNIQPPECRQAFIWSAWVLKTEEEGELTPEAMSELRVELESLEAALRDTEMSDYLRLFIQRQVNAIRDAIRLYGVQGARPVAEAVRKVAGDLICERMRLQTEAENAPEEAKSLLARAVNVIKRTAEVCDDLEKVKKTGESAASIAASVAPLVLPYIAKLLAN